MEKVKKSFVSNMSSTSVLYKAFYFVFYAGYISFLLYVPVYFKYLGLSAFYVGLLNGIRPLMQTIGAPLWGVLGDRYRVRRIIFIAAFVIMTVKTMLFLVFRPQNEICIVTYYNSSKKMVKNTSYVIEHGITKRSTLPFSELNQRLSADAVGDKLNDASRKSGPGRTLAGLRDLRPGVRESKSAGKGKDNANLLSSQKSTINKRRAVYANTSYDEDTSDNTLFKKRDGYDVKYTTVRDDKEITYIFIPILLLIIFGDAFDAAVFTLADTSCLDSLGSENYGYYRLWGSAGWGIMTPIIGFVISHFTVDKCGVSVGAYFCIFYFYLGFMYLALLFGSHFEFNYEHNDLVNKTVKSVLLNFHYGVFLFVTFYAGFCYGFLLYFVNWFIDSLGGSALIMGTATACKSVVDVLFFFLAGKIIEYLGHLNTVTVSLMAYIGAFVSYSYVTEPWYAIPIEVLHSGAYALVWSSSVSYLNKAAPAGSSATVQGILQGVYWGLGTGGGTIIGGFVVHNFGFTSTFRTFAVTTSIILLVFLATQLMSKFTNVPEDATSVLSLVDEVSDDGETEEEKIPDLENVTGDDPTGLTDKTNVSPED